MGEQYIELMSYLANLLAPLPSLCAICHGWGRERVCASCIARFAIAVPRCQGCARQVPLGVARCGLCIMQPPLFAQTVSGVDYAFPWDQLILQFKFHAALDLTATLGALIQQAVARRAPERALPDWLLPVPLSARRLRERGFNQAWELSRWLSRALRLPCDARLLRRVKHTPHQLALPLSQRRANVRNAFALTTPRPSALAGRSVALIDDIMTSGATAAELTRVLLDGGAQQVEVWTVARTLAPRQA
jgi:ComF family protein